MHLNRHLRTAAAGAAVLALAATAACGGDGGATDGPADPDAEVTISVGDLPPTDQAETRGEFLADVEAFEKANPHITVEPKEDVWQQETWGAMLAGGTMPTVMRVPYTEPQALIARGQAADLTDEVEKIRNFSSIRENLLRNTQDDRGRVYGVPVEAYSLALVYNRELFEQAGLDPDRPPRTWDQVREAARTISAETDAVGFQQMTNDNTGGWMFSALTYSFGGTVQEPDGKDQRAAVDNPQARQALEFLRTLRWDDGSMGGDVLLNQPDAQEKFAAGQVGMYIDGGDSYKPMVENLDLDPDVFGVTALPQQGGRHGTLGGGAVAVVRPDATPEQQLAAMKWIDFREYRKWFDKGVAVSEAEAQRADGLPVGGPKLPVVDTAQDETYLTWIERHIDAPRENFAPYTETVDALPVIPEPPDKAQETYAVLDTVVQAALTRRDADPAGLLADAEAKIDQLLQAG
ncbi:extracellular solute-binding protein [Streptomyces sp. WMMC500]|uniref:ABC transporter substrate-binding protein n=1 Tax=Streptomyces sp. WMMC500 TaxID=3015154 RepID=UPI00248C52DF|nr:extracellular solute-binding protein [Streptomyces sp. WMMC500]WBB61781.1 extracellular solute-binding protein [Streptomyces sp. WMMC500]